MNDPALVDRKVLFLDVDGVLNNRAILEGRGCFGTEQLQRLHRIVAETGCDIILSSSWRDDPVGIEFLLEAFKKHNIPVWKDITPSIIGDDRWPEIRQWLMNNAPTNGEVVWAVVLDDWKDAEMGDNAPAFVAESFILTRFEEGLTDVHVERAIRWFGNARN